MGTPERRLAAGILVVVGATVLFLLSGKRGDNPVKEHPGAFTYSLEPYLSTDPAFASWEEVQTIALGRTDLHGLAVDGGGKIAVLAGRSVVLLDERGERLGAIPLGKQATAVAWGAGGSLFLATTTAVEVRAADGSLSAAWEDLGEKAWVTSLAVRGSEVFVADAGSRLVWRFDTAGRLLGQFGRKDLLAGSLGFVVPSPYFDVAVGADGSLWVVNPGLLRVEHRGDDGELLDFWGKASMEAGGFSGCCNPSHLALLPDGSFVTSEKGLPRVKVYSPEGALTAVVAGPEAFSPAAVGLDLAVGPSGRIMVLDPPGGALRIFARREIKGEGKGDGS